MSETDKSKEKWVGVEVSSSAFTAACLGEDGSVIETFRAPVIDDGESAQHLVDFVEALKERFGDFSEIGIAVPGLVNQQTGRVAYSTHIPKHVEIDLLNEISSSSGIKIRIENDANAAAFGEYHLGAGRGAKDLFYVKLAEGVGGALVLNNELWRGDSGFAGEFGYVAINSEGMRLEEVASTASILDRTRDRFHQDPTSSLNEIGEDNITLRDLIAGAKNQDGFSELMLERTGVYIGTALASVINLLNVERIVVEGEIMHAGEIVIEAIRNRAKELSFAPSFETVEIVCGELGENAGAIGAAWLLRNGE